jgi:hypothetical protein
MRLAKEIDAQIMMSRLVKSRGTTVTTSDFKRMMNEIINPFGAKAVIKRVSLRKPRVMKVAGCYWTKKRGTKIILHFHLDHRRKKIFLNTRIMNRVIFLTSQTLQHELIHQHQDARLGDSFYTKRIPVAYSKKIQKTREDNIKYLSMKEEVDCYGQNIAMELVYNHPNEPLSKLFRNINQRKSPCYKKYTEVFNNTEWGALRKELLKKVWKWLPKVSCTPRL